MTSTTESVWAAAKAAAKEQGEDRFRVVAGRAAMPMWVSDAGGRREFVNEAYREFLGPGPGRAGAKLGDWRGALHPEDARRLDEELTVKESSLEPFTLESRLRDRRGRWRWLRYHCEPRFDAEGRHVGFIGAAYDITEAKQEAARRSALLELNDRFGTLEHPADLAFAAAEILARTLEVSRAGYGRVDLAAETLTVERDWTAPGVRSLAGVLRLREYGSFIDDFKRGETVAYADVARDPRAAAGRLSRTRAALSVPVMEQGELVALLFLNHEEVREWRPEELAFVREVAQRTRWAVQRRLAELELRAGEARFSAIVNSIDQMVWSARPDGYHDFYNQRWYDFTGLPEGSTDGDGWNQADHPEDQARAWAVWRRSLETGESYHIEYRLRHRSGQYRWVLGRAQPVRDAQGRIERWFGTCTDIQEIVEAREVLARSREALERQVVERTRERDRVWSNARDLLAVLDLDGVLRAVNPAWTTLLGYAPSDLIGRNLLEFVWPEDVAGAQRALAAAAVSQLADFENRCRDQEGGARRISWHTSREGDLVYAYGRDVTAQWMAAEELRRSEARLRAMFETSYQYQGLLALDGALLESNPASLAGIGARADEVIGKPFWETPWFADTPGLPQAVKAAVARAAQGETVRQEMCLHLPSGWRWFDFTLRPMRDQNGEVIALMPEAVETTDRRNAEEALRQSQKLEAMGQLTGGVAHDFNNLLTPIIGGLDLLQRLRLGGPREQRLIEGALHSAERARILVQRLLAFARRQPLQPSPVDVGELVTGMAELVASTSGPKVKVAVDVEPGLPPARADANQLEMAILNLSVNARDAMPEGGTLTVTAASEAVGAGHRAKLPPGRYVRLSVADTGVGMDEATLARAVEPFFSTKGVGKGTGLGLSMAHGLASQLGGAMTLSSRPGLGTNVELWLPVSAARPGPATAGAEAAAQPGAGTALLVDDEQLVRESTTEMLYELGYEVVQAASAEEALQLINAGLEPDLLVTDHLMPGMTGVDLARAVRARRPDARVLVISGFADADGLAPDLPRLTKPFRAADLAACLKSPAFT